MFAEKIASILQQTSQLYERLFELSQLKKEAILSGNNDKLIEITGLEEKTATEIEKCEKTRQQTVSLYLDTKALPQATRFAELIEKGHLGDNGSQLAKLRTDVLALLKKVKDANDENIALIASSRAVIDATLDFIKNKLIQKRQATSNGQAATYSKKSISNQSMNPAVNSGQSLINFIA